MTGFVRARLAGKTPAILKSGMEDARTYRQLWETLLDGRVWHRTAAGIPFHFVSTEAQLR